MQRQERDYRAENPNQRDLARPVRLDSRSDIIEFWAMAGLAMIGGAGIPNALLGRTNIKGSLDEWYAGNGGRRAARRRCAFAIAPLSGGPLRRHEDAKPREKLRSS